MRVLVLAEKRSAAKSSVLAFRAKGMDAKYVRLSKVVLVSRPNKTIIRLVDDFLENYDAVYVIATPAVAPFVEPLIEELNTQGKYVNARPGSFFLVHNEPFLFVTLALGGVSAPRTLVSGSAKNIEQVSKKITYPVLAKSFVGKRVQQAIVVNTIKELNSFVASIKQDIDGFMLREFIEDDIVSCAVVGTHVFAVKRKFSPEKTTPLDKGTVYKLTDEEKKTVHAALKVSGHDIARIDIVGGKVIDVSPVIPFKEFDAICSENIESFVADFFAEKIAETESIGLFPEFKDIPALIIKKIFGRFLK